MSTPQHLALARKWRPKCFSEVVGQHHVVQALENALNKNQLHHAYLFTGTRGVGKTTIARILAKSLNCEKGVTATPCGTCSNCTEVASGSFIDLLEVDAASRTKVEDTRDLLEKVQYAPAKGRYKIYLIDEVHMLSGHSFNALLKTLEEPPAHVKFLLATTDPQKLPATVLSRCLQFHLTPLPIDSISKHLEFVLQEEQLPFEHDSLTCLAQAANGSVRDSLSLLEQAIAYGDGEILLDNVKSMLGLIDQTALHEIINALYNKDANELLQATVKLTQLGVNFDQALNDLLSLLHHVAVEQAVPTYNKDPLIQQWAQQMAAEDVQLYYQIALIGRRDIALAPTPQVAFEMTLLRMLSFTPNADASDAKQQTRMARQSQPTKNTTKAKATQQAANSAKQTQPISGQWREWLPHLQLTGIAHTIVQNCSLRSFEKEQVHLILDPLQAPLLQAHYVEKIQQAISRYLNATIKLQITNEASDQLSPQQQQQNDKKLAQTKREQTILKDNNVQKIMETFDATVIKESIIEKREK